MNSLEEELEDGEIRQEQPPEAAVNAPVLSKKQQKKLAKQEKKQNQIKGGFLDVYGGENVRGAWRLRYNTCNAVPC